MLYLHPLPWPRVISSRPQQICTKHTPRGSYHLQNGDWRLTPTIPCSNVESAWTAQIHFYLNCWPWGEDSLFALHLYPSMASSSSTPLAFQDFSLVEYLKPKTTFAIEDLTQRFSNLQVSSNSEDWPSWSSEPPEPVPSPPPALPFFTTSALALKFFHYYNHPLNSTTKYISSQIFPRPWNPSHLYRFGQGIGYQIEVVMPPNPNALSASP